MVVNPRWRIHPVLIPPFPNPSLRMRTVSDIHENELRALLSHMRFHRRSAVGTEIAAIPGRLRPSLPGRRAELPRVGEGGGECKANPGFMLQSCAGSCGICQLPPTRTRWWRALTNMTGATSGRRRERERVENARSTRFVSLATRFIISPLAYLPLRNVY